MARPDKASAVAELTEEFRTSSAAVLTEYRGLTVAELKELRRSLGSDTSYSVVKNTLTKIAAQEAGVSAFDALLQGPSAIAFVKGDPVEAAKGLRDFAKAHPFLVIKGGVLDGKAMSPDEIRQLADLESREVLLAKLAGAMQASLQNAVYLFAAPLSQAARVIDALRAKAEADPSILRGGAGTPAPAAEPEAAVEPEAAAEPETSEAVPAEAPAEAEASTDQTSPEISTETSTDAASDEASTDQTSSETSSETSTDQG
jgi:large subunit ribosomal protein L10